MISDPEQLEINWKKYRESQDEVARAALLDVYLPLVETLSGMIYARRVNDALSYQDMLHYGMTGLLEALERYSPDHGADFKTYASYRIKGEIYDGLSKATEVSSQIASNKLRLRQRAESLTSDSEEDILGKLIEQSIGLAIGFMLDGSSLYHNNDQITNHDVPYSSYELKELSQQLAKLVSELPEDQKKVIQLHYFQQLSFTEIAKIMTFSRSRISQLHKKALLKLRHLYDDVSNKDKYR